jgi:hypothetical protein
MGQPEMGQPQMDEPEWASPKVCPNRRLWHNPASRHRNAA